MLHFDARGKWPARDIELRIAYSSHVFTRRCDEAEVPHSLYSKPHDPRVFCAQRHELSLHLPQIIESVDMRYCYEGKWRNYFVIENLEGLPPDTEYWVFFKPRREADVNAIRLFIESAYAGDKARAPYGRKKEGLRFKALVTRTLEL